MGCLQRLGQPQRRGDLAIAGRNAGERTTCGYNASTATHAPAEEAEEEEKQWLVVTSLALP